MPQAESPLRYAKDTMSRPITLLCVLMLLSSPGVLWSAQAAAPMPIPVLQPQVVARYPHDTDAFTEGLQYLNGTLYESTGLEGQSSLRRVQLASGKLLAQRSLPRVFGEGLTVLNKVVYQLTWQDQVALMYAANTLKPLGQQHYSGEGWGLTNDGVRLIMSNGSATLTWRDPNTFAVTRTVSVTANGVPVTNLNELEYVGGQVYANIWLTNRIARIDPQTGRVTAWIDVSALTREVQAATIQKGQTPDGNDVANGIAYNQDKGTFLLTGKRWPTVFEVKWP